MKVRLWQREMKLATLNRGTGLLDKSPSADGGVVPKRGKNDDFSPIDCFICRFYRLSRLAMDVCGHRSRDHCDARRR
jgi:hypothetical protein